MGHYQLKENLVCVPGNSVITEPGQTSKIPSKISCLVKQAEHLNKGKGCANHSDKHHKTECLDSAILVGC